MGLENTIAEQDMDAESRQQLVNRLRAGGPEYDPDLDVDGLTDSIIARLKRFFSFGRA